MIDFAHPCFLVLLGALPWLALPLRRSLVEMTGRQRVLCTAMRALILLALALTLSGVRLRVNSQNLAVLFVVDDSASISPEAKNFARAFVKSSLPHARGADRSGVIGFANGASIWQ